MKTNKLKIAAVASMMLLAGAAMNAQTVPGAGAAGTNNIGKETAAALGSNTGSVRVVDNKGTIKYLQSNNGVTMFTDETPDGGIITTWQLGGTLTEDTYIDATGNAFVIDGIANVTDAEILALAGANIVDGSTANPNATTPVAPGSGFAFLVRDELTGETKKLNITDLINSEAAEYTVLAADQTANSLTLPLGLAALDVNRIQVYRNGVKLRGTRGNGTIAGSTSADYTVSADGLTLTVAPPTTDWMLFTGDIIEYYYAK